jgi:hypothetical protein
MWRWLSSCATSAAWPSPCGSFTRNGTRCCLTIPIMVERTARVRAWAKRCCRWSIETKRVVPFALVGVSSALLFTEGCATVVPGGRGAPAASSPRAAVTGTPARCRVTEPTRSGIPSEVAKQRAGNVFGEGRLWVGAWWTEGLLDQVRSKSLADDEFPYTVKYPTWTLRDGKVSAEAGAPQVRVKRVDAPGHGEGSVGGYATEPPRVQWRVSSPGSGCCRGLI